MSRTSTAGIRIEAVQDSIYVYAPDAGSTDSYVITLAQPLTAYVTGQALMFKANTANTGACSINIDGLGAVALKKQYNNDLATGDILAGQIVHISYDGTNFQVTSDLATAAGTGDMVLASIQTNSGLKTFLDATFGLRNVADTITSFITNTATVARTWTFPNKDGTVAMTSDLTGGTVTSVSGTADRITSTGGTTPVLDISATFEALLEKLTNKSTTTTLGTSDTLYPTQNAVKTYVDGLVAGLLDYRGAYDASVNTFPASGGSGTAGAVMKGDMWIISVAGSLGGTAVQIGDSVIANVDTPGQTAGNWNVLNSNISYVPEDVANKSITLSADQASDTKYPSVKSVYDWATGLFALITSVPSKTTAIVYVIDGGGTALTTGSKGYLSIPFACTITGWTLTSDVSGSVVIDVKKSTYANFPTTSTITSTDKPTLSSVQKNANLSVSVWTTAVSAGDILEYNVDSATTITKVTLTIVATKT